MNAAGIIFLSLGILFLLIPAILATVKKNGAYTIFSLFCIIGFGLFPLVNYPEPGQNDVKEGKAIYIKEVNIGLSANGDTLYNYSTYRIEWLPEWKYGRKQN